MLARNVFAHLVVTLFALWAFGAIVLGGIAGEVPAFRIVLAAAFVIASVIALVRLPRLRALGIVVGLCTVVLAWYVTLRPSNRRAFTEDQSRLATIDVRGPTLRVRNVRDFRYASTTEWTPRWYDADYDLRALEAAYFIVEPFEGHDGPAHTFVSFRFADERYLAVSIEIRKEVGETFAPIRALYREYELQYVFGDERDLVDLRANHRHDEVFVYPIVASKAQMSAFLLDMVDRANALARTPEFYNILTSTCTTNLVDHLRRVSRLPVPRFDRRVLLPAHSAELAHELGLLGETPFDVLRARGKINARAASARGGDDFSTRIRVGIDR